MLGLVADRVRVLAFLDIGYLVEVGIDELLEFAEVLGEECFLGVGELGGVGRCDKSNRSRSWEGSFLKEFGDCEVGIGELGVAQTETEFISRY